MTITHTDFEHAIREVCRSVEQTYGGATDEPNQELRGTIETAIEAVTDTWFPDGTLTPIEQVDALMTLSRTYGVDDVWITEETSPQSLEENIETMFSDAVFDVFTRQCFTRITDAEVTEFADGRVTSRDFPTTPVETRLAQMPEPRLLIAYIAADGVTEHESTDKTVPRAVDAAMDDAWPYLSGTLDPAQQVYVMVEATQVFDPDGVFVESGEWPNLGSGVEGWSAVIRSGHLYPHLHAVIAELVQEQTVPDLPASVNESISTALRVADAYQEFQ